MSYGPIYRGNDPERDKQEVLESIFRVRDEIQNLFAVWDDLLDLLDQIEDKELEMHREPHFFLERYGSKGFRSDVERFFGEGLRRDVRRFFGPP